MIKFCCVFLITMFISVNAQTTTTGRVAPENSLNNNFLPNFTPPTPSSYALGEYGNVPVGLSSGTANLEIPLLSINSGKISTPISLFYGNNGIKVDDTSGKVGLGWNLNFGGVITRVVRDLPDEDEQSIPVPNDLSYPLLNSIPNTFVYMGGEDDVDTEADLFSFNFNGISGKFILDDNNEIITDKKVNLKFQKLTYDQGFTITNSDGVKYYFTEIERTRLRGGVGLATSWYLSHIQSSINNMYFKYTNPSSYNIDLSNSQNFLYVPSQSYCGNSYGGGSSASTVEVQRMAVLAKRIDSISTDNVSDGVVVFNYNENIVGDPAAAIIPTISKIDKFNSAGKLVDSAVFTYVETQNKRIFLKKISFLDPERKYLFEYNNPEGFPSRLSYSQDHWGYFNGKNNLNIYPNQGPGILYNNQMLMQKGANKQPDENFGKLGLISKVYYPTGGYSEFLYEGNAPGGGLRIKSINDVGDNSYSKYRRFYYSNPNFGNVPFYYDERIDRVSCPNEGVQGVVCNFRDMTRYVISSSSLLSLFDSGSSATYYQNVAISYGGDNFEKGKETKEFIINRNSEAQRFYGNDVLSAPLSNNGWNNLMEKKSEIYKNVNNNLIKVSSTENNYEAKNAIEKKSVSFRKNFNIVCDYTHPHKCTLYETYNYPLNPCYRKSENETVYLHEISNIDAAQYKFISQQYYLKSQTNTEIINSQNLDTTTEYFYDNFGGDFQMSSQKTIYPDQATSLSIYKYAIGKGDSKLIAANMVGIPLETETKKNGKSLGRIEILYDNPANLLPSSVLSYNIQNDTPTTEVTYDQYDNLSNLQQYTTKAGIPTAIIWGYNQTEPIAKIAGATYAQVSSLATSIIAASNSDIDVPSENTFIGTLDTFRKDPSMANFQITTYTYDPLIGLTSITPPSGIREIYKYDTANRLQSVVDVNGNILKEYQYNYKQ